MGFFDNGFLIVVSDHGQLLGEKGNVDHLAGLNEELIHVPLAIRPPGGVRGQVIDRPIDITWLFFLLTAIASDRPQALRSWLAWTEHQELIISEALEALYVIS